MQVIAFWDQPIPLAIDLGWVTDGAWPLMVLCVALIVTFIAAFSRFGED